MAQTRFDNKKQELAQAARDQLLLAGLSGLSMRKVASACGVSATAIYRHYQVTAARAVASRRKPAVMYYACEERAYAVSGTVMGPTSSTSSFGSSRTRVAAQFCGASSR